MDSVRQWLCKHYRSVPADGPQEKRVKFSDLHEKLTTNFAPHTNVTSNVVSQEIKDTFPGAYTKAVGRSRAKYVFGIERVVAGSECEDVEALWSKVRMLEERIRELEQPDEMNHMLTPDCALYHGPNTIEHFDKFSMDSLMEEARTLAPDLYTLLQILGRTERHTPCRDNEIMTLTSPCTLLKSRSQKVLGIQLLIGLMLLARSTNKQV